MKDGRTHLAYKAEGSARELEVEIKDVVTDKRYHTLMSWWGSASEACGAVSEPDRGRR